MPRYERTSSRKLLRTSGSSQDEHNSALPQAIGANNRRTGSPETSKTAWAVWVGRIVFLVTLLIVAVVLGVVAFYGLRNSETSLAETQFASLANRATVSAANIVSRKRLGALSTASVVENAFPESDVWPFVAIRGFETISNKIVGASSGRQLAFAPFVFPDQRLLWEEFAYDWMHVSRLPSPFPKTTGVSSFGKGMWENDSDNIGQRKRSESTNTSYGSPYDLFTPLFQISDGANPVIMLNLHAEKSRGRGIDAVIECAEKRAVSGNLTSECQQLSAPLNLVGTQPEVDGPGAIILMPIHPVNDPLSLTGVIASSIVWREVLEGVVESSVSGVDCILETPETKFTYRITNGVPRPVGMGDMHDTNYEQYGKSISVTQDLFSASSVSYNLTLYPTADFFEVYSTRNPISAAIGAACIIVLTSLLFILYDFLVRKEFTAKRDLLQAKREFMRFVSHEVRTPLNSVSLGAKLLSDELGSLLGLAGDDAVLDGSVASEELVASATMHRGKGTEGVTEETIKDWLGLMKGITLNTNSAVNVLNELLQWDKIEAGNLTLELSEIGIEDLVQSTTREFEIVAQKKNVHLSCDILQNDSLRLDLEKSALDKNVNVVVGDSVRLVQCIRNLVSNALKFSFENGEVNVRVQQQQQCRNPNSNVKTTSAPAQSKKFKMQNGREMSYEEAGFVIVTVTDKGAGMMKDELDNLFRDGVQFSRNKLQSGQGSGLGLYVTKGLVEQHGGTLKATSLGQNKGTTFSIRLPLYRSNTVSSDLYDVREESPEGTAGPTSEPGSQPKMRILVVDDAAMNRKLLARLLTKSGHVCVQAVDGNDACDKVKESQDPFDTILMDKEMPECDGPTAVARLRANGCDSFIVGLTGSVLPEDIEMFQKSGVNHILAKPFKQQELEDLWVEFNVPGSITEVDKPDK